MKYLFILFFALTSNLSFASYHDGDSTNPGYDDGDSGYSSGGSAAIAIIGLGVLGYYLLNNNSDEDEQEFSNQRAISNFEINFVIDALFSSRSRDPSRRGVAGPLLGKVREP